MRLPVSCFTIRFRAVLHLGAVRCVSGLQLCVQIVYSQIMSTPRTPRRTIWLADDLHAQFAACARRHNHIISQLLWCWLRDAVAAARRGESLPAATSASALRYGKQARWSQSTEEYHQWAATLEQGGSSVEAVLQDRIRQYVAAEGDAAGVGSNRPPREPCYAS